MGWPLCLVQWDYEWGDAWPPELWLAVGQDLASGGSSPDVETQEPGHGRREPALTWGLGAYRIWGWADLGQ